MNLISLSVIFTYFVHRNDLVKSLISKPNRTETVSDFDVSTELYHSDEFCDPSNTLICNEHYSPRLCICYTNHMLNPKGAINKTHPPLCKSIIPVRHIRNFVLTFAIRFPVPEYFVNNPDLAFTTAMEIYSPPITKDRKRFIFQIGIVLSRNKSQNTTYSGIPFRITEDDLQIVFPSSFTHNSLFVNMKVLNIASVEETKSLLDSYGPGYYEKYRFRNIDLPSLRELNDPLTVSCSRQSMLVSVDFEGRFFGKLVTQPNASCYMEGRGRFHLDFRLSLEEAHRQRCGILTIEDEFAVLVNVEENSSQTSLSNPDENTYFIRCPVRKPNPSRVITSEDTWEKAKSSEEQSTVEFSSDVGTTPMPDAGGIHEITAVHSNQHSKNMRLIVSTSQSEY
ncbi:hypothetical protein DdX_06948 [Ditylenchus destructor]|uniref:Uncharacterized protein n=1 Tax=Ditylenchus destructor TaxID=166010 RepID=A0AAD4N588_9BILA|nr:hypothetical protein DdX_06948 [Ditylenchus destructor]